jgi:hypothetical protein
MPGRSGQGSSPVRRNETKSHAEERALAGVLPHFRLGHESLDVTLAYLNGKDAESEEAREHANSSSLALYA